jgi:endonuclease/exonuclease/phosphatase family metal-dependent hydrolase
MTDRHLIIKSVNVHRSNDRIHALLNRDDNTDILLIQEPWFGNIATLRSDTDPRGSFIRGAPHNNKWDVHIPKLRQGEMCKALGYSKRGLTRSHGLTNAVTHPLSHSCSLVLELKDDAGTTLRIINTYHAVQPNGGHTLHPLLNHEIDDQTPTVLIGDFNTHAPRWSLPGKTPSRWAGQFTDWLDTNLFSLLNPDETPTWLGSKDTDQPSVIDLGFANAAALMSGQIGELQVSAADALASDHAALLIAFTPLNNIALLPAPAPKGYKAEAKYHDAWTAAFHAAYHRPQGAPLDTLLQALETAIEDACKASLPPKRLPDPRGAPWWNDDCTAAHTIARSATN